MHKRSERRSLEQIEANEFDLKLFNLIRQAEDHSADDMDWGAVALYLMHARNRVRQKMHFDDQKETAGE